MLFKEEGFLNQNLVYLHLKDNLVSLTKWM